ncbi:MAG: hypothetical protein JST53_17185 [Actinobacteria bacterium]|nr:hypothetical protein [Actinomycetota bacterium]
MSVPVGEVDPTRLDLLATGEDALRQALATARAGTPINAIGRAIEPIIAAGLGEVGEADDGWTYKTVDGSCSAHFEHTLVVTEDAPLLLTA